MELENTLPIEKLPKELIKDPYNYIMSYYESIYPYIGGKIFSILSLVPVSLIMPKILRKRKEIKQKINLLLISSPGTGKSSIAKEFEKIAYHPITLEHVTDSRLFYELSQMDMVTLIISDISKVFSDDMLVKQLENLIGDESMISRNTMQNKEQDTTKKIDAVSYLSGTPDNISNKRIRDGLLSRVSPLIITHSLQEHEGIIDFVNDSIGEESVGEVNYIPHYFAGLYKIQKGQHSLYGPIIGYDISKEIKESIKIFIKPLVKPAFIKFGIESVRELEETYRILCASAVLNYFNRQIIKGKIIVTRQDLEIAKFLIKREIATKYKIISTIMERDRNNLKTMNQLKEWLNIQRTIEKRDIGSEAEFLLRGMVTQGI